jgi:FKBP-type peptidyl-prolyl cis-trans isomerase FkpA
MFHLILSNLCGVLKISRKKGMKNIFYLLFSIALFAQMATAQEVVTEHGYRFKNHSKGTGKHPQRGETALFKVRVYAGSTLMNSSEKNPGGAYKFEVVPLSAPEHYPPMYDASLLMGKGDSATIYQAVDSTMRRFLPPAEQQAKEIRFELVLLDIISLEAKAMLEEKAKMAAQALRQRLELKHKDIKSGLLDKKITSLASGLRILVEEPGNGPKVKQGEALQCHYFGFLAENGKSFDNSFERRKPLAFPAGVGQMIAGFDEGVMQLNHGAKAWLLVPNALGYGDQEAAGGLIPPKSDLMFYIEIF